MSTKDKKNYILKDKEEEELFRLKFQHQVWSEETDYMLKKAGVCNGQTVLDLGCGPGYLSYDLSKIVGPEGKVIAVDKSEKFTDYLKHRINEESLNNLQVIQSDLENFSPDAGTIDTALSRWVLMFVSEPEIIIENVVKVLKPKGIFAVFEYYQFLNMHIWPASKAFDKVYNSVYEHIKMYGGDADIGAKIPELFHKYGLKILETYPVFRIAKPDSPFWKWLEVTSINHDMLVKENLITGEELQEYYKDWSEHSKNSSAFFSTPPVLVTIGMKE
ncbi:class I SAM-dependent methyltransferase [Bacteroidota bacterium]